eukprot:TRINITY_DN3914_c0_g1_i1.p1 TRINITY_DN3914_c0_g1~~TRINITY_DN3914_c0_g1_i1.p1  ORF type:complete len:165 (-),score=64.86 TRINITY_DN3914_c0_g1_i1:407-832(-)
MERIEVTGTAIKKSKGPTGLNLSEKDTPQAISIIDSATIEEVLSNTTGCSPRRTIAVKALIYMPVGFYLNNFVKDGIASAYGIFQECYLDPVIYEQIEVIRGVPGFMQGAGAPSETVNLASKKASKYFLPISNCMLALGPA